MKNELEAQADLDAENTAPQEATTEDSGPGIYVELGELHPSTPITEAGLAKLLGRKCIESIKRSVAKGDLPSPVKLLGKNTFTAGAIIRHLEDRLESEKKKFARLRP
jgi:hypothetical protein